MKITFTKIFKASTYSFQDAFDVFNASLLKVFVYFVFLNLMMLLPISIGVVSLNDFDYERFGMNFATTEIPEWLPGEIPTSCEIYNGSLDCGIDHIFEYDLVGTRRTTKVYFNVPNDQFIDENNTVVFYHDAIYVTLNNSVVRLSYIGFEGTDFAELHEMEQADAAAIIFENFYQSVKPVIILPIILMAIGALFIANLVLIVLVSLLSMLFSFGQSNFPKYQNMLKLFMMGSTIPALINIILGFLGLSAFTSLTYNFITPIIVLLMYRASRRKLQIIS